MIWAQGLILLVLILFFFNTLLSHVLTWRRLRRWKESSGSSIDLPPISIIKPVRGLDQEGQENFLSFMQSAYPAAFEILFCLEERDDPAVPLVQRLIADSHPLGSSRLIFSKRQDSREIGKTINLMAGIRESKYDFLVLSDSDVRNTPGFLEALVRPLLKPTVGMVYASPAYKGARNWGAALMGLTVNETVLAFGSAAPVTPVGSTIAVRKDVLRAIGGLAPMRHRMGIDAALGRAVRMKGFQIELAPQPATIIYHHGTFASWWEQIHRWMITLRRYTGPRYFFLMFQDFPVAWATLYLFLTVVQGTALHGLALWGCVCLVRLASSAWVNRFFAKESELSRHLWLVCLLDFLRIPLWVQGFVNPHVVWRGKKYRVMPDATVRPES